MAKLIQLEPLSRTQADRMQKLEASVLHLSSTINNILDLSKIEANKLVLDEVPVNMDDLVAQVVHMLLHRTEAKGLQLHAQVDRMPLGILGDSTRLTQALLNFAGNAVKFTNKGSISIAVSILEDGVSDALVKLEVQDTGVGIAGEAMETLFQPFVQADVSTTRQHGGTGLGLVISKHLAEAMGGTIGFQSELGVGSRFWFTARLRKSMLVESFVQHVPIEVAALTLERDFAGRRVLLAEDDEFNREIGEILLQNVGLRVDLAVDGQEAVDGTAAQLRFGADGYANATYGRPGSHATHPPAAGLRRRTHRGHDGQCVFGATGPMPCGRHERLYYEASGTPRSL
jgi:CheY-like chemotaxis protein